MHLHFEKTEKPSSYSDSNILTLSWMGKVPDGLLQTHDDEGWKLNRANYYQDGWIATGNSRSIVGVTYTTCRCRKTSLTDLPQRTNYNLRGHRSDVIITRWNEPYQKLASCDSSGIVFVWIKFEGRWSIELINDRNTQVTDFSWSHDGRMMLICYIDGFVLIGSVAGQRYWSSVLNLDSCSTTCCSWSPDDQQVMFGTSNGHIIVIDISGTLVAEVTLRESIAISAMNWSCEKFKMEDNEEESTTNANGKTLILAVAFTDGILCLMKNYDDLFPVIIRTGLQSIKIEWSNKAEILAVAGHRLKSFSIQSPIYINEIQFYTETGTLRYTSEIGCTMYPITAFTWGHNDKRLFVATGPILHIAWVTKRVASLQLLSRLMIYQSIPSEKSIEKLPLPPRLQSFVASLFGKTLRCYLPDFNNIRNFVSFPPASNIRLQCTLIRHDDDIVNASTTYILYLEHLGGLIPLLKGKRASKLRPEFVIFDPQAVSSKDESRKFKSDTSSSSSYWNSSSNPQTSDSEFEESFGLSSPKLKTKRRHRFHKRNRREELNTNTTNGNFTRPENIYTYADEMPEHEKLLLVTSNIWGTKFKFLGLVNWLPSQLGSLTYRTSLLHLQPRQMTLLIKELGNSGNGSTFEVSSIGKTESGNQISSEEEDESGSGSNTDIDFNIPIAPMTPKKNIRYQSSTISPERRTSLYLRGTSSQAYNSYGDYVNFIPSANEELLTLQINGDSNGTTQTVSVEMTAAESNTSSQFQIQPQATSNSISTQTSFQSITEILNLMIAEKSEQNCNSAENKEIPSISDTSTEEAFNEMARKFSSEFPCSSRTPATQSIAFNKYEYLHNNYEVFNQINSSPLGSPSNISPPKTLRHKLTKIDTPRKANISYISNNDHSGCDTSSMYMNGPRNHLRLGAQSTSISSNWGVSVYQCNVTTTGDTCMIDTKPVHYQSSGRDVIKYIDDNDADENETPTIQQQFGNSPSFLYRNKSTTITHHFHPVTQVTNINNEFTNIRSNSEGSQYSQQRRLTLRNTIHNQSLENTETESQNSARNSKDRPKNCMLLDEESEDKEAIVSSCSCINTEENERKGFSFFESKNGCTQHSTDTIATSDSTSSNSSSQRKLSHEKSDQWLISTEPQKVRQQMRNIYNKGEESPCLKHRGSLPQNMITGSNSITSFTTNSESKNRSLPASPLLGQTRRKAQGKGLFYSPMMLRKVMKQKLNYLDCSSEDDNTSDEDLDSNDFQNLESFQKKNMKKKIKVKRKGSRIQPDKTSSNFSQVNYKEFVLHNKPPLWNEVSQVYQLDFGGRVTQESAKNFQIEYQGKQVMQFGRIDDNAYTLDFQHPFSALQALAVALANVTQRLK
ncbi:tubby-related protein 4-like protein [Dinothrombium tinctorium]|uniref:Tubby-related protein 4-like protein n=1 Tax=Dinothrombium tinctorium TaxID=1965070 RepID=A0A3S3Q6M8_9ACAR|nr:tubby-related protein 4-like protein [Dinothrombium tinctorium]RWS14336.1 tubby-related protein 4-like protein [Dinothrombium tinctorium]RWS14364.1 tubby-related protein 4-like protein [Dinothrombium tinctorium]RWS14938.1 tubby-related protein 4-like protein [Dinothrombium tinctorium]